MIGGAAAARALREVRWVLCDADGSLFPAPRPDREPDPVPAPVGARAPAPAAPAAPTGSPDPRVLEPLRTLSEHFGLAAIGSGTDARTAARLEVTGTARYFPPELRFSAQDSPPRPPHEPGPAVYRFAGQCLGLGAGQAVAVEDRAAGTASAVAAGWPVIGNLLFVAPAERAVREVELREAGACAVVRSWWDVVGLLCTATARGLHG
ncbi:hypothetical protein [Kineococcus arenarius]|uniref:hypothetical protein n=1 Tax=Kineococcus sp. SYSU DK007 TaxID=3383128 RepID=UPI003D7DEC53